MFLLNKSRFIFLLSLLFTLVIKAQTPVPSITLQSTTGCTGVPLFLTGQASPDSLVTAWAWTSTNGSQVTFSQANNDSTFFTANAPGTYTVTLTVAPVGPQSTATVAITISQTPSLTATPTIDTVCLGSAGLALTVSAGSLTGVSYLWSPAGSLSAANTATVVATPTVNTTYLVTGTKNGCSSTDTVQLIVLSVSPVVASASQNYVCVNGTATLNTSAPSALSYSWAPVTGLSCSNCANPIASVADTMTYTLTVTGNCFSNYTDTVKLYAVICDPPVGGFKVNHSICRYECVTFTDTSKIQPLRYKWYFQGGIPDSSSEVNPTVCYNVESNNSPNGNGKYWIKLIVTNIIGLTDTVIDSIRVKISPIANINNGSSSVTIELGTSAVLNAAAYTSGATSFSWSPTTGLDTPTQGTTNAAPQQTTTYVLQATNGLGCKDYDTITVKVEKICGEIFIPTAFSPNNDGVNDYAKVLNNNCVRSIVFRIFDRWGNEVYSSTSTSPLPAWDGNFQGKPMDAGVFTYYVDAVLSDNVAVSQKGTITLVR